VATVHKTRCPRGTTVSQFAPVHHTKMIMPIVFVCAADTWLDCAVDPTPSRKRFSERSIGTIFMLERTQSLHFETEDSMTGPFVQMPQPQVHTIEGVECHILIEMPEHRPKPAKPAGKNCDNRILS
jgi:hypothetical protein